MRPSTMTSLLRGVVCAGLIACPLLAAGRRGPGFGPFNFWSLILGMMLTMFGGMALCFGVVKLGENIVHRFQARHHVPPVSVPPMRHAA